MLTKDKILNALPNNGDARISRNELAGIIDALERPEPPPIPAKFAAMWRHKTPPDYCTTQGFDERPCMTLARPGIVFSKGTICGGPRWIVEEIPEKPALRRCKVSIRYGGTPVIVYDDHGDKPLHKALSNPRFVWFEDAAGNAMQILGPNGEVPACVVLREGGAG